MRRDIDRRVDALETRAGGSGWPDHMVFKWSSWTNEKALAEDDAGRQREGLPPRDPNATIGFLVWNDSARHSGGVDHVEN